MIKKVGNKYHVYSESGTPFGTYDSLEEAKKRLQQMEMYKHMSKKGKK